MPSRSSWAGAWSAKSGLEVPLFALLCQSHVVVLGKAFRRIGIDVWRASADSPSTDWEIILASSTQLVIAEGVPADVIPDTVWEQADYVVQWWLSTLFYEDQAIFNTRFHAVATNSYHWTKRLTERDIIAKTIELAAPREFAAANPQPEYESCATYLGCYPHKTEAQMAMMFEPASRFGLTIWGYGWEDSPYKKWHKGVLPLLDIGKLYRSVDFVLALTKEKQQQRGMINNRIYEALAAGAVVVSGYYPALAHHEIGQFVNFVHSPEDAYAMLERGAHDPDMRRKAQRGQELVMARHTYSHRAKDFIELYNMLVEGLEIR